MGKQSKIDYNIEGVYQKLEEVFDVRDLWVDCLPTLTLPNRGRET